MKKFVFLFLLFSSAVLFAENLTFKLSPSFNGFDILLFNNDMESIVIPEPFDGSLFRFCVITTTGKNLSKRPSSNRHLGFIIGKRALTVEGRASGGVHFEKLKSLESIPSEEFPVYLFGFFKTLINTKEGFNFFGPILVSFNEATGKYKYSFEDGDLPSKVQSQFEMEFKYFQHPGSK